MNIASYDAATDRLRISAETPPTILSVCFEPTNACPGRCPYCLIEDHQGDASTEALSSILRALLAHGTMRFGFGGGEPLLRSDIYTLGQLVRGCSAGALLRTSGMFQIDPYGVQDAFDWVDVSFDSSDPDVFRRCRPGVDFQVLQANILRLAQFSNRLRVSVLITQRNQHSISQTIKWLHAVGVSQIRLQRLVRRGQAKVTWDRLKVPRSEETTIIQESIEYGIRNQIEIAELGTISNRTLCVVKGDGALNVADPSGLIEAGSVFENTSLVACASLLYEAQVAAYSPESVSDLQLPR